MSEANKTLKQENSLHVRAYVAANLLIFWFLSTGVPLTETLKDIGSSVDKIIESGTISILICILTVIISGQFSSDLKYILVFWRLKNTLPGCRAFSCYVQRDPRINLKNLHRKFVNIPTDPVEQNRLWYRIYKKRENDKIVIDAHKNFLLLRELTSLSFIFFIALGACSFFTFNNLKLLSIYSVGLLILFLLSSQAAKTYGIRLVTNVLAVESISED